MNKLITADRNNLLIDFRDETSNFTSCQIILNLKTPAISYKTGPNPINDFKIPDTTWLTLSLNLFTVTRTAVNSNYYLFTRTEIENPETIYFYQDSILHTTIEPNTKVWIIKLFKFDFVKFTFNNVPPNTVELNYKNQTNYSHCIAIIPINDKITVTSLINPFKIPDKKYAYILFSDENNDTIPINNFTLFIS